MMMRNRHGSSSYWPREGKETGEGNEPGEGKKTREGKEKREGKEIREGEFVLVSSSY